MATKDLDQQKILSIGLPLIKQFEGLRLKPYLCSAGVPTIGYGSTYYEEGRKVTLQDALITEVQAVAMLTNIVLKDFLPAVYDLCPTLINENQAAAILSWVYNLGVGALRGSTLRKKILSCDWAAVPAEILKWNIAGGHISVGLKKRREAESKLFSTL